jgi:methionyl-tRNA formyltransferase
VRVVFMGTPQFSVPVLEKISTKHEVVGVYVQPDKPVGRGHKMQFPPVKQKAIELGLKYFQPEKMTLPGEEEKLRSLNPDVVVVVAFGQILKKNILSIPKLGCINIHASLLPRWRGAAPIQWSILAGDEKSGVCTMRMVEKLDAGNVLLSEAISIDSKMTTNVLHEKLSVLGSDLIMKTLDLLAIGNVPEISQDETQVTYASKLTKEMGILDLDLSVIELDRKVRALNPWPGTRVCLETGEIVKVQAATPRKDTRLAQQGWLLFEQVGLLLLGAKDGALEIEKLQFEGGKSMTAAEYFNGLKGKSKDIGQKGAIRVRRDYGKKDESTG